MPREIKLGLGDVPARRFLFVSQDDNDPSFCWYERDRNADTKHPVPQRALTGYITGLRLHEVVTRFGPRWKLDIQMNAGDQFTIRSGVETTFTRGIVLALTTIDDPELLRGPLTITVSPSEEGKKAVFGHVYFAETGQRIDKEWDKDIDLIHLIQHLQTVLGDGGQAEKDDDHEDQQPREARPARETIAITNGNGNAPVRLPQPAPRPAGLATHEQIKELLRAGRSVGIGAEDDDVVALALLNVESARIHDGKTVEQLTLAEAIGFRKTLLSM